MSRYTFVFALLMWLSGLNPVLADVRWVELGASNNITAKVVAVGDAQNIWALDDSKIAHRYYLGEWQKMPGQIFDGLAAAADGTVLGIHVSNTAGEHNKIYSFDRSTYSWNYEAGMSSDRDIYAVSTGGAQSTWGIDKATAYPCHWDGSRWVETGQEKITVIAAGAGNSVIGVNVRTNNVYFYDGGSWTYNSGVGKQLLAFAGNRQNYLFTDRRGYAKVYFGGTAYSPGSLKLSSADIGSDGTALGIANGKVYRLEIDSSGRAGKFSPQSVENRRQGITFLTTFSKGYYNDSITRWGTELDGIEAEFQSFHDNGFNGVLIGYAPTPAHSPGGVELPDQRFNYDPVDVAESKGLKAVIDIEKYIKPGSNILYSDDAKKVIEALKAKTSGQNAIAAIHLYGEVDSSNRAQDVNSVAAQITDYPTLAVAQERHIGELAVMDDVIIPAGNYDDPGDLQGGYTEGNSLSFEKLSRYANGFWYLVPWVRDYTHTPNLPWRSIYGAVAMGARGLIWTPVREVGAIIKHGEMKSLAQYVEDINKKLLGAGLDSVISAFWRGGKLSPASEGSPLDDNALSEELRFSHIALNPENDVFHAGLFTKYRVHTVAGEFSTTCEYYVLLLNWQDVVQPVNVKIRVDKVQDSVIFLSADQPPFSFSQSGSVTIDGNSVEVKTLTMTLPAHGAVLLQLNGHEIRSKYELL